MKTNYVPAIVMLLAGLIDCILAIGKDMSLVDFTRQLLLVLVIFLIIGWIARIVLDKTMKMFADKKEEEKESKEKDKDKEKNESVSEEKEENTK